MAQAWLKISLDIAKVWPYVGFSGWQMALADRSQRVFTPWFPFPGCPRKTSRPPNQAASPMAKAHKSVRGKPKAVPASKVAGGPVVRIPGLSNEEIGLIDRAAEHDNRSRADWLRLTALAAAATQLASQPPVARPNGLQARLGSPERPIRSPADVKRALAPTYDPDA